MNYLGIDFGTTTTVISCLDENGNVIPLNVEGIVDTSVIPSLVYFKDGVPNVEIGSVADRQSINNPDGLIMSFKIGMNTVPQERYKPIADDGTRLTQMSAQEVAKYFFRRLDVGERNALRSKFADHPELQIWDTLVVTVPVRFDNAKKLIREAVEESGLVNGGNLIMIDEPTAAAIAFFRENPDIDNNAGILIYDFGGGTFDVSIVSKNGRGYFCHDTDAIPDLGGDNITQRIIDDVVKKINIQYGTDIPSKVSDYQSSLKMSKREVLMNLNAIWNICNNYIKPALSDPAERNVVGTISIVNEGAYYTYHYDYTFAELESLIEDDINRTIEKTEELIHRNNQLINTRRIIIAGGTSNILMVQSKLRDTFSNSEIDIQTVPNSEYVNTLISRGAVYKAQYYCFRVNAGESIGVSQGIFHTFNEVMGPFVYLTPQTFTYHVIISGSEVAAQNGQAQYNFFARFDHSGNSVCCSDKNACRPLVDVTVTGLQQVLSEESHSVDLYMDFRVDLYGNLIVDRAYAESGDKHCAVKTALE